MRDQVAEAIRKDILSNHLPAGSILVEKDLADRFGVSKTPAREALTLLSHEGLVDVFPRKGYMVTTVTVQDLREYFELRAILECAAVEMAAPKLTDEQLRRLYSLSQQGGPESASHPYLDRNFAFHCLLAQTSGNQRVARLIEKLLLEMQRLITLGWVPGEHERLLKALEERNPDKAGAAMREHIMTVRDAALRGSAVRH